MNTYHVSRDLCAFIKNVDQWLSAVSQRAVIVGVFPLVAVLACMAAPAVAQEMESARLHVNIDRYWDDEDPGNPPENGETWATAFRFLQDALDVAHALIDDPNLEIDTVEIWVAAGKYRPDQRAANSACGEGPPSFNCCPPFGNCDSSETFNIWWDYNISIHGGFAGSESSKEERPADILANRTYLDGDLKQDDNPIIDHPQTGELLLDFQNYDDNSNTVVWMLSGALDRGRDLTEHDCYEWVGNDQEALDDCLAR